MKKIVSIISIFAIILSATQFVLADYSDDTTITDGQFAYKKGTNNILAYVGTTGDPIANITNNMAAEEKARASYEGVLKLCDDPQVIAPLQFLREREVVHFQRFGEALNILNNCLR
mgnify:CR=1 FL=1